MRLTLQDRVSARLEARLQSHAPNPVAIALSGGGDSMALLDLAARWAAGHGRSLLALTMDHGLNAESATWSAVSREAARSVGAAWQGLAWTGPKPATGLPAAARAARHALIAEAARAAGARVILFAHTADDVAESDWMRARGTPLGRLRAWGPSPAWPEGRGLMLLRPLLTERRAALRDHLKVCGRTWLDDPANDDLRFGRARARRDLAGEGVPKGEPDAGLEPGETPSPRLGSDGPGAVRIDRHAPMSVLAAALVCAGGGSAPPRGERIARLHHRLAQPGPVVGVLSGARVATNGATARIHREAGEWRRCPIPPLPLTPGREAVWDGRFAITAADPGWSVMPASGLVARLELDDRRRLQALPSTLRPTLPVLIRDTGGGPVLAGRVAAVHDLVAARLARFLGEVTHEVDLSRESDGGTLMTDLFLPCDGALASDRMS